MNLAVAPAELRQFVCTPKSRISMPRRLGWFMGGLLRAEAWLDRRAARRSLFGMDERTLADIGLTHPDFADRP